MLKPLYLPGNLPPEDWVFRALEHNPGRYADELKAPGLATLLAQLRQQFDGAADKPTNIIKARFATLADSMQCLPPDIARRVGLLALGEQATAELRAAWQAAYAQVAEVMKAAATGPQAGA